MVTRPPLQVPHAVPSEIEIAQFVLTVDEEHGEQIVALFRERLEQEFFRRQPLLMLLYTLEVEETSVWTGSRKSRNKARLKRKKAKGVNKSLRRRLLGALGGMLVVLRIVSIDYAQIGENFDQARKAVEQQFRVEGTRAEIDHLEIDPRPGKDTDDQDA